MKDLKECGLAVNAARSTQIYAIILFTIVITILFNLNAECCSRDMQKKKKSNNYLWLRVEISSKTEIFGLQGRHMQTYKQFDE